MNSWNTEYKYKNFKPSKSNPLMKQLFANSFCDRNSLFVFVCGFARLFEVEDKFLPRACLSMNYPYDVC